MSITIGIYDLFAYTIPGLLYIFVLSTYLWQFRVIRFGIPTFPDNSGMGLLIFGLVVVAAHLLGHLLDFFAQRFVFGL